MTNNIDVMIRSFFDNKGVTHVINQFKTLDKSINQISSSMTGFDKLKTLGQKTQEFRIAEDYLSQFNARMTASGKIIGKTGRIMGSTSEQFKAITKDISIGGLDAFAERWKTQSKNMGRHAQEMKQQFSMSFLGIMFFGMMLQKTFEGIAKNSVNSLMKITEGMHPAAQAVNVLTANMEMLKFTIGEAIGSVLIEMLPILVQWITKISDWISQNKELTAWLILGGVALGFVLFMGGQLWLGIEALINVFNTLKAIKIVTWVSEVVGASGFGALLAIIGTVVLIIGILYAAWESNLGDMKTFLSETLGIIWSMFKGVFTDLLYIVKDVFGIIVAIMEGDWDKVWTLTKDLGKRLILLITRIVIGITMVIGNLGIWVMNSAWQLNASLRKLFIQMGVAIQTLFVNMGKEMAKALIQPLNTVIGKINSFISWVSKESGLNLSRFLLPTVDSRDIDNSAQIMINKIQEIGKEKEKAVEDLLTKSKLDYFTLDNYETVIEGTTKLLGLDKEEDLLKNISTQTQQSTMYSEQATTQNFLETESILDKVEAMSKENEILKENLDLKSQMERYTRDSGFDLSIDLPNYSITRQ